MAKRTTGRAAKPAARKTTVQAGKTAVRKTAKKSAKKAPARKVAKARAVKVEASDKKWNFRLYVAGQSPKSQTALANLRRLCEAHLGGDYHIDVVDLLESPHLAKADQILAIPTLVRKIPEPIKRVIGDLSNADRAMVPLDIDTSSPRGR